MKLALAAFGVSPPPDFKTFAGRVDRLAAQAALGGADILVLPEYAMMVLAGAFVQTPDMLAEREAVSSRAQNIIAAMAQVAARHKLYLLAGSLPMVDGNYQIHNRAPFFSPTGKVAFQDKQTVTRFEAEQWGVTGGAKPNVFNTTLGMIGISICYDAEFPLHVRAQVTAGARLILIPTCTDTPAGFNRVCFSARARAIENQCYTAVIPLVGQAKWSESIDFNHGQAAVFTPCDEGFPVDGILSQGHLNEAGLLFTSIDPGALNKVRVDGAVLNHLDWPDEIAPAPIVQLV
jgi:predicted amidohydrolase